MNGLTNALRRTPTRAAVCIVGIGAIVFYPTWLGLVTRWNALSETDGHGFIITATSVFLIFRSAIAVPHAPAGDYHNIGLLGVVGGTLLWVLSYYSNILLVQSALIPIILYFAFVVMLGFSSSKFFVFPLFFLYLAIPIWGVLSGPLQNATIVVVSWFLSCIQVPVLIDGEFVYIPSGTFQIASGCAGLHFFVVALALSALYSYLYLAGARARIILMIVAAVSAVVVNWIRVASVIVAGHVTEMQHFLVTVDHYYFGWVLFVAMLVLLYFLARRLERSDHYSSGVSKSGPFDVDNAISVQPRRYLLGSIALCFIPLLAYSLDAISFNKATPTISVAKSLDNWVWLEDSVTNWAPDYPGAKIEIYGEYRRRNTDIQFYTNVYTEQSQGNELVSETSHLIDPVDAYVESSTVIRIELGAGRVATVNRTVATHKPNFRQVLLSWYQVGGVPLVRRVDVKVQELLARLRGDSYSGMTALKMDCATNCSHEEKTLIEFLALYADEIGLAISDVR